MPPSLEGLLAAMPAYDRPGERCVCRTPTMEVLMHPAPQRRSVSLGILLVLAVTLAALSACTMTQDNLTSVSLERSRGNRCIKECDKKDKEQDEKKKHKKIVEDCNGLRGSNRSECEEAELNRHKAILTGIADDRKECENNCHRQGGGRGD